MSSLAVVGKARMCCSALAGCVCVMAVQKWGAVGGMGPPRGGTGPGW